MKKITGSIVAMAFLAAFPARASGSAASMILDRHVAAMKSGNLAAVIADYADDAVVITPHGVAPGQAAASAFDVFPGIQKVRTLFAVLTDKDHVGSNKTMQTRYESRGNDVTLMYWVQNDGTPQRVSGLDIFVIRGNKIEFQDVTIDAAKPVK